MTRSVTLKFSVGDAVHYVLPDPTDEPCPHSRFRSSRVDAVSRVRETNYYLVDGEWMEESYLLNDEEYGDLAVLLNDRESECLQQKIDDLG